MFITVLVFCYFVRVGGQESGRGRPGWAGYREAPGLRGWLGLRRDPADWSAAAADCLREDAVLASPWSPEFTASVGALATREGLPMLYSGARATLPFIAGGAAAGASELVRCSAFLADGSSTDVPCTARLPYACYAADPGPASRLWPGYEYSAALRGWLKLHSAPRDWPQARIACHLEGAFLSAPWSSEFTSAVRALAARAPQRAVHAGVRAREHYADAAYSYVDGAPVLSLEPAALVRSETCITLLANGTEREVSCSERLPFVCYAPLPTAPAPTPGSVPSDLDISPSPLPLRPTAETATFRTLRTVPTTSSSPITNPTTTTTTAPDPTSTTSTPTSTTVPTSTTTFVLTTKSSLVPTTSTVIRSPSTTPVPSTTSTTTPSSSNSSSTTPSNGPSPTTAVPFDVCEEMGLVEYQWEDVTEQCYRFHPYGATWPVANETCVREGAALAVANSREEAMVFTRLLLHHLKSGIQDARFKGAVALGFYWDQEWKTVDGTPLEQTGYAKWWPGWPRDQELAPYGFMEHTGRLENYATTLTTPFICEALS